MRQSAIAKRSLQIMLNWAAFPQHIYRQPQMLLNKGISLKEACDDVCIDAAAELDMFSSFENVKRIIPHLQMFYADVKCMDPGKHKKWTGQDNAIILENIRRADVYQRMCFQLKSPIDRSVFLVYAYSVC